MNERISDRPLVTIEQLAQARYLSLKINHANVLMDCSDTEPDFYQALSTQSQRFDNDIHKYLSKSELADRELQLLIYTPINGLWLNAEREAVIDEVLSQWICQAQSEKSTDERTIAELKLLFYFGSFVAMTEYVDTFYDLSANKGFSEFDEPDPAFLSKPILSLAQLAKVISIGRKISHTMSLLDSPDRTSDTAKANLTKLQMLQADLSNYIPQAGSEDPELMALICSPINGLWLNAQREKVKKEELAQWIRDHEYSEDLKTKKLAELKLLFFFGTTAAKLLYIDLYYDLLDHSEPCNDKQATNL